MTAQIRLDEATLRKRIYDILLADDDLGWSTETQCHRLVALIRAEVDASRVPTPPQEVPLTEATLLVREWARLTLLKHKPYTDDPWDECPRKAANEVLALLGVRSWEMKAQRFNSQTEPDLCGAKSPNGAFCNRTVRHRGEHQAFGPDTKQHAGIVYERWPRSAAARLRARPQQEERK
jgi:hypothetical protein